MHNTLIERRGHTGRLRNVGRKALSTAIIAIIAGFSAFPQSYPNGLSADSVDPQTDSVFIREMKTRMDRIRRTERRPTVALVLSGGGAKGSAHVGVLKVLEEMQIPVDMICGTSMGGLVGGLYSMGYPAAYLDSLLRTQNWEITLSDKVDNRYIPYADKEYRSKYLLSIPFHYERPSVAKTRRLQPVKFRSRKEHLDLDADAGNFNTQAGVSTFASSLPSGYVYGFNVNNLISSLTVGYQDSLSFTDLPIPYFSVAADIISYKAKNWGCGSLKDAMRSTMSIPGMFDPVWTDGMVLVDGGTRNNFPVDLARAMGADYVIGVELSDTAPGYEDVNNIGDIILQFITMLGKDALDKNLPNADVLIHPDLEGFNMLSFNPEAIDTLIQRGYAAAMSHRDELQIIKGHMKNRGLTLNSPKAIDIGREKVTVDTIRFEGLSEKESRMMMRKIKLGCGEMGKEQIDIAMQKIQATKAFETATYSLLGKGEPYRLEFNCTKGPVHQFGIGFRIDTQEWASVLLNLGLNTNKLKGSKLDIEAKLGQNQHANIRYALDIPAVPTVNAELNFFNYSGDAFTSSEDLESNIMRSDMYNMKYNGYKGSVYLSNIKWTTMDVKGGVAYRHLHTKSILSSFNTGSNGPDLNDYLSGNFFSAFADAELYTFDNKYFPSKGTDLRLNAEWIFNKNIPIIRLDFKKVFRLGNPVAIITDIHLRNVLRQGTSICLSNVIGGSVAGRYIEQQIPFIGFNKPYWAEDHVAVANIDLRVCPKKNLYISALAGCIHEAPTFEKELTDFSHLDFGFGGQVGYNTIFGPIKANICWSSLTGKVDYYISAGFDF